MSHLTIYFGEKPVFLSDNLSPSLEDLAHHTETLCARNPDNDTIHSFIENIGNKEFLAGILLGEKLEDLKIAFEKFFTVSKAGGGIIQNKRNEILLIYRRGKWDLPKGKLDEGESIEECALREVQEETGLVSVSIVRPFTITYHTYKEQGKFILKESHWFLMQTNKDEKVVPQIEEDIMEIRWIPRNNLEPYFEASYPAIADMLGRLPEY